MSRAQRVVQAALATLPADQLAGAYYVNQDLDGRVTLRRGTLWEWQDKRMIRGFSESFGVPDDGRDFHRLPFVHVLVAPLEVVNEILAAGMDRETAEAHLVLWAEATLAKRGGAAA
jgi:hypothetical protein